MLLVNLPKPAEIVARLFVLAGHPHNGRGRGEHVLTAMRALCPNLKEDLVELWDMIIPKLLTYLQGEFSRGTSPAIAGHRKVGITWSSLCGLG